MNRKPRQVPLVAVSLVCILILAACSNSTPFLRFIVISPSSTTIPAGTTQQFTATGYYSNGSTTPGLSVSWASSSPSVATIDPTAGVATGVAAGTASITATAFGVTSSPATLTVESIVSIAVTPANQTVASAGTVQFQATGTYSNPSGGAPIVGTTGDLTAQVTWSAAPTTLATFSTSTPGLATAGSAAGSGTVSAALSGVMGSTGLTVANGPVSLVITPTLSTIAVGNSTSITVQEKWTDGTLHAPASGAVTWSSDTTTVANVVATDAVGGAGTGAAAGFSAGTANITACELSGSSCSTTLSASTAITVVTGSKHYGYLANVRDTPDNTIGVYTVTPSASPYMAPDGSPVTNSGVEPVQVIPAPNGKFMYAVDVSSNVLVYNVSAGIPSYASMAPAPAGSGGTNFGRVDPYNRFVYVSDDGSNSTTTPKGTIYGFTINQTTGALTPITAVTGFTTNLYVPESLLIDNTGSYLYAVNYGDGATAGTASVSAYSIDQSTGALTPLTPTATFPTGLGSWFSAMDATGTYIYTANNVAGTVSSFSIGSGGALTSLGADITVTGAHSVLNVAVAPNGKYLYVLDSGIGVAPPGTSTPGQVFGFALTSGVPGTTPIAGTPAATGVTPNGIAIDSTGSLLAVENSNLGNPGTISLFTIDASGGLTAQTPVATGNLPYLVTFFNAP